MFAVVLVLVAASVVLTVIAPKILGAAMDVIFNGVIGSQLPAGVPLETLVEAQRAAGNGQFADMLAKANIVPGAGIDFMELSRLIIMVLGLYIGGLHLHVAAGVPAQRPGHARGLQAPRGHEGQAQPAARWGTLTPASAGT